MTVPRAKYWIQNQNFTSIKKNPGDCGLSKALNHPRRVKRGLPGTSDTQVLCNMKEAYRYLYLYRWSWFLEKSFRWFDRTFFWDPLDLFRAYISIRPSHIQTAPNIILTCLTSLPWLKLFYKYNNICKSNISFESKKRITKYQHSNLYLDWTLVIGARWGLDPFADKNSEF